MMVIQPIAPNDVDDVAVAVAQRFTTEASRQPLINPEFDYAELVFALRAAGPATWIARRDDVFSGHLFGAVLEDSNFVLGAWVGPDGVSYDTPETLVELYAHAGAEWIERGAMDHFVWTFDDERSTRPWSELGFARIHQRGARRILDTPPQRLPYGLRLRLADAHDIDAVEHLDKAIDGAQRVGPSFLLTPAPPSTRADLVDALDDPDIRHFVIEDDTTIIAQCQTFTLPVLRGAYLDTLHLSGVSVLPEWRGRGVGTVLVEHALRDGWTRGHTHAQVNWRVTNYGAARFWKRRGFIPTFVRLHRTVGRY